MRLKDGRSPYEGRVDVRKATSNNWESVCDDGWDDFDARVVCAQLGFTGNNLFYI